MDDLKSIAQLLDALRPWHRDLVIVGGWAHRLYRFHDKAARLSYQPVRTRDADLAFGSRAPLMGDIGAALKAADFNEVLSGEHTPPISEYRGLATRKAASMLNSLRHSQGTASGEAER